MNHLTRQQKAVWSKALEIQQREKRHVTILEIASGMGKAVSTVHKHVQHLKAQGLCRLVGTRMEFIGQDPSTYTQASKAVAAAIEKVGAELGLPRQAILRVLVAADRALLDNL